MSEFIENIKYKKLYDNELLHNELKILNEIAEAGDELIEKNILNKKLNTNKIEFGVLDNYFYIQVIVQTYQQDRYKPIEVDKFKFSYPIEENQIVLSERQIIERKIFNFYLTKIIGFLSDLNIRYI